MSSSKAKGGAEANARVTTSVPSGHLEVLKQGAKVLGARLRIVDYSSVTTTSAPTTTYEHIELGVLPPMVKTTTPPSVEDTIQLFTLSSDQALSFARLAQALVDEQQTGRKQPPIRAVVTGEPGAGKSQVRMGVLGVR